MAFLLKAPAGRVFGGECLSVVVAFASRTNTRYVSLAYESALAQPTQ